MISFSRQQRHAELAGFQHKLVFRIAALAHAGDINSGPIFHGTNPLANATPIAQSHIHVRLLDLHYLPVALFHLHQLGPDGFVRDGTMFLTNNTRAVEGIRQAAVFIEKGQSDVRLLFLCQRQQLYRAAGTNLPAQVALMLTISHFHAHHRRPESLRSRFESRRLDRVGHAHFHALAAPQTARQKFGFRQ